jgi:hypothetical protein
MHGPGLPLSEETILSEVDYAWNTIDTVQLNESAWNYIRGYMMKYPFCAPSIKQRYSLLNLLLLGFNCFYGVGAGTS